MIRFQHESVSWNATIVLEAILFFKDSFSAPVIFSVIIAPVIFHVPRIAPVTPWERVFAMDPQVKCLADERAIAAAIEHFSFKSPTVPCQHPMIFVEYSIFPEQLVNCLHRTPNKILQDGCC